MLLGCGLFLTCTFCLLLGCKSCLLRLPAARLRLLAVLRGRGVRSVLCEGGPTLNAELLRAGGVDELFLCLAPKRAGEPDAPTLVTGVLHEPAEIAVAALFLASDDAAYITGQTIAVDGGFTIAGLRVKNLAAKDGSY